MKELERVQELVMYEETFASKIPCFFLFFVGCL